MALAHMHTATCHIYATLPTATHQSVFRTSMYPPPHMARSPLARCTRQRTSQYSAPAPCLCVCVSVCLCVCVSVCLSTPMYTPTLFFLFFFSEVAVISE